MQSQFFPVINSTLSPTHLAVWLAQQYGFKNVECRVLKTNINHTYRVTADGVQYILRVYNPGYRSAEDVAEEVRLLNELKDVVRVSYPVADAAGGYIQEINAPEGMRHAVLFSFAAGKKARQLTTAQNRNIGAEVGSFHHFTRDKHIERVAYTADVLVNWAHEQLIKYFSEELEEMRFIKAAGIVLTKLFGNPQLTKGIVHLDLWYDNMCVQDDGTVTFFDFDNCGNGWLVLDVGYYCMQLFYTEPDKEEYEQKKEAFIKGYLSKNELTEDELALIPYAGIAIWIQYQGVAAKNFDIIGNFYLSENYLKMIITRMKEWLGYNGIEIPNLTK